MSGERCPICNMRLDDPMHIEMMQEVERWVTPMPDDSGEDDDGMEIWYEEMDDASD